MCILCKFWNRTIFSAASSSSSKKLEDFVLLFDESHSKANQTKQIDIHTRFWDDKSARVQTRYFISLFLEQYPSLDKYLLLFTSTTVNNC